MAEPHSIDEKPTAEAVRFEVPLGFGLNFISGRGLLTTHDRKLGPLDLRILELEIPDIAFPFDVTGGAERFKSHRCILRHLVFGLDADGLADIFKRTDLSQHGFIELKAALRDGCVEFAGRFAVGEHQADFTFRAALLLSSPTDMHVVFYDARVYGWLPIPAGLIPEYLRRGLGLPYFGGTMAGAWVLQPLEQFLREVLPRDGWKIPDVRQASLTAAEVARGRIFVVGGQETELTDRQVAEREPPAAAVRAREGIATFAKAEEALGTGKIQEAYERFREAVDDERGGQWARERLLQLGAADPELAIETRQLAEEVLKEDEQDVQALLALAAIATRERSWGEAANRYGVLVDIARERKERYDTVAAELAAATAAAPIDPAGALAAYERAAARARDSVVAHRALLELRSAGGDWNGAANAGERLVRLDIDPPDRAGVHRELGFLYLSQLNDLKKARLHFERSLRITPDDPKSLEGIAETYAARGEPARAASYLARLAEQAEESSDEKRIISLNLRLGEIWERWLGDPESAASRYHRVLDVEPRNRTARLRLAKLAEERGDVARARALYEDVLAVEEERGDPEAIPDLVAAYTRLARVTLSAEGPTTEAIACLERAVELDPRNRSARDELARVLRDRGEWSRLIRLLEEAARVSVSPEEARQTHLAAARLELEHRQDRAAAQRHLEEILAVYPADTEALDLLVPILEGQGDVADLIDHFVDAAGATAEPSVRGDLLYRLAVARESLDADPEQRRRDLDAALDANPYHEAAAEALVRIHELQRDHQRIARALQRLAIAGSTPDRQADAHLRRGVMLWRELHDVAEAEAAMREAVIASPANLTAWTTLSRLLESRGDLGGARTALESALTAAGRYGGKRAPLHERLAELARTTNDLEAEAHHTAAAIDEGLLDDALSERLVTVLGQLGRSNEAASLLEKWADAAEGDEADSLWVRAADVRRSVGDGDEAMVIYRKVVASGGSRALHSAAALERLAAERNDFAATAEALRYQLAFSDQTARPPLLERLVRAQIAAHETASAEETATEILETDPLSPVAHGAMAKLLEAKADWLGALQHFTTLLLEAPRQEQDRQERRAAFVRAVALAHEVQIERVMQLQARFDDEYPEAPPEALATPLGVMLAQEQEWERLLALRLNQVEGAEPEQAMAWRREIAEVLHRRLGRSEQAITHYQDVIANRPDDIEAREALADVFGTLGRWGDLASLLFAMSQLAGSPAETLDYGLRSAQVYIERVRDTSAATQVLRTISGVVGEAGVDDGRFADALRTLELYPDLADHLERMVDAQPGPESKTFAELVSTLRGPLADVPRAVAWCERIIDAFPTSDTPRELLIDLLTTHEEAGDPLSALQAWADARSGPERARLLADLSERYRAAGNDEASLAALAGAAEAEPNDQDVLKQLIDRHTARSEWAWTMQWLDKLVDVTDPGTVRDERLRRLAEIATDYEDAPEVASRALRMISGRTVEETRQLARLYAKSGDVDGLSELEDVAEYLDLDDLLLAAKGLASKERLDLARQYLQTAMQMGALLEAWELAAEAWRRAGRLAELGRWRLAHARSASPDDRAWLQLLGTAELVEAGEAPAGATDIDAQLAAADLRDVPSAWAVFCASKSLGKEESFDASARALEAMLQDDDRRLRTVLKARYEAEMTAADHDVAVELARRLAGLGIDEGLPLLERALDAAGRLDELRHVLEDRARLAGPDAPELWTRVAALYARAEDWGAAVGALTQVAEEGRTADWAKLAFDAGTAIGDDQTRADAAKLAVDLAKNDTERATWLRRRARVLWWSLGLQQEGRQLLAEAQELKPWGVAVINAEIEEHLIENDAQGARRIVEEGLAVLDESVAAPLWLRRARLAIDAGDLGHAATSLQTAERLLGDDASDWDELSKLGRDAGDDALAVRAAERAFGLDASLEEVYLTALEEAASWKKLIEVLDARSEALHLEGNKDASADRLLRASRVAREQLGDDGLGLHYLERTVKAAPTTENMRTTFRLAASIDRTAVIAALGTPLLKRIGADDPERVDILHRVCGALERLHLEADAREPLGELIERGEAAGQEKRMLGRLVAGDEPEVAAGLFEEAVDAFDGQEQAELLFDAATAWRRADQTDRSRAALERALEAGVDSVEAHRLSFEILKGHPRLTSIARLIELQGDVGLEATHRAQMRQDLAKAYLAGGHAQTAHDLLVVAADFGRPDGWAAIMEGALSELDRKPDLAKLWLDEAGAEPGAWSGDELISRVREATEIYRASEDTLGELRALQVLTRLVPDDAEAQERLLEVAASLGDADQFRDHVEGELAAATTPRARAELCLRYAPIFDERFDDLEAAVRLLRRGFDEAPNRALAEALADALVRQDKPGEAVAALIARVAALEGAELVAVLLRAAGVAHEHAGDERTAYGVYLRVIREDASNAEARDFCLKVAAKNEAWKDMVEVLERSAAASQDEGVAYAQLVRAADVTRDRLRDPEREITLLEKAVDAQPTESTGVTRLLEYQLSRRDFDGALGLVLGGHVIPERELNLALALLQALRALDRKPEIEQLMEFIANRHVGSTVAVEVRLRKAREAGDNAAFLREAQTLIWSPEPLDEESKLSLLTEAGRAAMALGKRDDALRLLTDAADIDGAEISVLLDASELAEAARDQRRLERVVGRAVARIAEISETAGSASDGGKPRWMTLLGRAHESLGDSDAAVAAYDAALKSAGKVLPTGAVHGLGRLYEKSGDWQGMIDLYEATVARAEGADEKAELYHRMGEIWQVHLVDEDRASEYFAASLKVKPGYGPATIALGMLLYGRNQFERALPMLLAEVDLDGEETPIDHLAALADCFRQTNDLEHALGVTKRVLDRDASRHDLLAARAEMFEALQQADEAETEWRAYLDAIGPGATADQIVHVRHKLAKAALGRDDTIEAVNQLEQAYQLAPADMQIVGELRGLYERIGRWENAAELRVREATAAPDEQTRAERFEQLADICISQLDDVARAATMLERAAENAPGDITLLRRLLDLYEQLNDWRQYLVVGERVLATAQEAALDARFFAAMAHAYDEVADDPSRAKEFFEKAVRHEPTNGELMMRYAEFAKAREDYRTYAEVEERAIDLAEDVDEKVGRRQELAEIYLQQLGDLQGAAATLFKARELRPDDSDIVRSLADTYALDAKFYPQAADLYRELLEHNPLDVNILRILSRLNGQMGDNDRAYGYYAALMCLVPSDEEAKRFVEACRPAIPAGPQRPLTDADRVQGLIHPDQSGPLEELFAPLARFAELTHPGDLAKLGVSERDQLGPTDERVAWMRNVLEPLGVPPLPFFVWRTGGFACRVELGTEAAMLVGATLADDATDRQRTFLVARSAELYRTGHALCDALAATDLGGLGAALCLAVRPDVNPPKSTADTPLWANTIAAPMTEAIRGSLTFKVDAYLSAAEDTDISRWKWGCLATAGRVAMLLSCDVEEAINAILRVKGFDDVTDEQRAMVIPESPEALDLLQFAVSDAYFKLRQTLGLALRRSK